ncbi:MAG TPA: glyoxalase/bleomycin resistance/extradiol dioxygenase family protein [Cellvibrionaceae bacterium]
MSATTHKEIYINLPVRDLTASQAFFTALGYSFNPQYTDENAACLILGENIFAMLLRPEFFQKFAPAGANSSGNEVLIALNLPDRAAVDAHIKKAIAAGASCFADPMDHGFMYQHSFKDLDGHVWEFLSMEAAA